MAKKGHIPWNKGKGIKVPSKTCIRCESSFEKGPEKGMKQWEKQQFCSKSCVHKGNKTNLGKRHSIETRRKMSNSHPKGELSPLWRKDRTEYWLNKARRSDLKYKFWREQVFKRDNYTCRITDGACSNYLEAHHILSWREHEDLRYQLTNGITLCRFHHPKGMEKEKRLAPYFQELVSVS